jgi:predicted lipoprotein with Yx(FWY)xxD motif
MKHLFSKGILLSVLILSASSCKKDYSSTSAAPPVPVAAGEIGLATSATLGNYLINDKGQALYMFAGDADGTSSCTTCDGTWPPVTADITNLKLDAGLSAADFATITGTAGKQLTYKGWPLYSFSPLKSDMYGTPVNTPEAAGATAGDGMDGLRFIAKPDYTIMLANKQLTGQDGINYKGDYTVGISATTYFTDGSGKTLYTFAQDKFNTNTFTLPDLSNNDAFPIYQEDQIIVPSVIDKTLFGKIIFSGKKQFTYKGWPLYFFGGDTKRGSSKGISVPQVGVWPVAVKDVVQPVNP